MRNLSRILITAFLAGQALNPGALFADTLILSTGQKIEGKIIAKTDTFVRFEENGVPVVYFTEEISRIIESPAALDANPAVAAPAANTFSADIAAPVVNPADETTPVDLNDLDRDKIAGVIKNLVEHRNDADLTQYFTSVTDEFKRSLRQADPENRVIPQAGDTPETVENFMLDDLSVNKDTTLTAGVSFFWSASYKTVSLSNDGSGWKINNIRRAQGGSQTGAPDFSALPDYAAISAVIENFYQHQNDADLTQCFKSVTDEFKKVRQEHVKKRRNKDVTPAVTGIKGFKVLSLELNGDTGMADVSFMSGPVTLRFILKKEGPDWKVNSLLPPGDIKTGAQAKSQ